MHPPPLQNMTEQGRQESCRALYTSCTNLPARTHRIGLFLDPETPLRRQFLYLILVGLAGNHTSRLKSDLAQTLSPEPYILNPEP